jgi:hypothetical protein
MNKPQPCNKCAHGPNGDPICQFIETGLQPNYDKDGICTSFREIKEKTGSETESKDFLKKGFSTVLKRQ